ncbi:FAD-dependent oxidoreductase [Catenulispora pinisilvae]|uniref:FAD-dependent oxidoreductase n=1 Tax=Catenulispora pinisilvae TaxID=2705253 RepID=UPI0018926299|nr:FAD-dependent oxidoreductase [Catenulispora pinisilvae]
MSARVCVIGAGLAGAALAWRLACSRCSGTEITLVGDSSEGRRDASRTSGGLVRAFDVDPWHRGNAEAGLAELLADPLLRKWAGYRRAGSTYILDTSRPDQLAALAAARAMAGVRIAEAAELAAEGWRGLPDHAVAAFEHEAGYISPHEFRKALTVDFAVRSGSVLLAGPVVDLERTHSGGSWNVRTPDGGSREYDVVVLATGAWTPALLHRQGWRAAGLTTKAIQYTLVEVAGHRPAPFIDETSGLFGRPAADGVMLLGVPTESWGVDPDRLDTDPELTDRALHLAAERLPGLTPTARLRTVVAADCYGDRAGLTLEPVAAAGGGVFTFSAGSGGSAKTVLPASTHAAEQLLHG